MDIWFWLLRWTCCLFHYWSFIFRLFSKIKFWWKIWFVFSSFSQSHILIYSITCYLVCSRIIFIYMCKWIFCNYFLRYNSWTFISSRSSSANWFFVRSYARRNITACLGLSRLSNVSYSSFRLITQSRYWIYICILLALMLLWLTYSSLSSANGSYSWNSVYLINNTWSVNLVRLICSSCIFTILAYLNSSRSIWINCNCPYLFYWLFLNRLLLIYSPIFKLASSFFTLLLFMFSLFCLCRFIFHLSKPWRNITFLI